MIVLIKYQYCLDLVSRKKKRDEEEGRNFERENEEIANKKGEILKEKMKKSRTRSFRLGTMRSNNMKRIINRKKKKEVK